MITFVATAFNEKICPFVDAMLAQTDQEWRAIIFHNGPNSEMESRISGVDNRISFMYSTINTGNWGTANRQWCIDNLETDWIVQTSIQDYWTPNAVSEMKSVMSGNDFIIWNSLTHFLQYQMLDSQPKINFIDWGNFAVRSEIARAIGINFPAEFAADGIFVEEVFKSKLVKGAVKINKILTVHN